MKTTILFAVIIMITTTYTSAQFAGGSGTKSDPYLVSTASELSQVRNYPDKYYLQIKNINLSGYDEYADGKGWMPIGGAGSSVYFKGHYDGQGFVISNLTIYRPETDNVGLFGLVGVSDSKTEIVIENLGLTNVNIIGGFGVGALAGGVVSNALTKFQYVYSYNGSVSGNGNLGGLIGYVNSYADNANPGDRPVVSRSFSNVNVSWLKNLSGSSFGGLIGSTRKATIEDSYSRSPVTVDNSRVSLGSVERVGGFVGSMSNKTEVLNSYSTGLVIAIGSPSITNVGGFIGFSEGNSAVKSSFWDIETSSVEYSDGGAGKTTALMHTMSTFADYNFIDIWGMNPGINDGYPYIKNPGSGILPVSLEYFKADADANVVDLNWKTSSEKNNDFFTVERSRDGINFEDISTVYGAGNSNKELYYTVTDEKPYAGISYYRLKQTDYDGTVEYFNIEAVNIEKVPGSFNVYPNPNNGSFIISTDTDYAYSYSVYDSTGKLIKNGKLTDYENTVNLENISGGVYFLTIGTENSKELRQRIVVE